jgi:hypothetical protein
MEANTKDESTGVNRSMLSQHSSDDRIATLRAGGFTVSGNGIDCQYWYGILSSRLGRPVERRGRWFQLLHRVIHSAIRESAALLAIPGTAAAPWIERAAALYGCPLVLLQPPATDAPSSAFPKSSTSDEWIAELCDQLFVLRARKGGRIESLVARKLDICTTIIRVAIWTDDDDAGLRLLSRGAVGWYLYGEPLAENCNASLQKCVGTDFGMLDENGPWLLHCTRGRSGPMPGQSQQQWLDEVLLGGKGGADFAVADVLGLIIAQQWLRANEISRESGPVVCLSELCLPEAIQRRTFRSHKGHWDFEPFGVGLRKSRVIEIGGAPVVYGDQKVKIGMDERCRWRFQASGKTYDWESELEWRVRGNVDLSCFGSDDLFIFAPENYLLDRILTQSPWPIYPIPNSLIARKIKPQLA